MTIDGYEDVPPNDAESLRKALAHQPVAVAICASPAMQVWLRVVVGGRQACPLVSHGMMPTASTMPLHAINLH